MTTPPLLIATIQAQDATHLNQAAIPQGVLAAGYDTGSPDILWTGSDYANHVKPFPAIHIDQDPGASDFTADILDIEAGAAQIGPEEINWIQKSRESYLAGTRPGQRWPGIYCAMNTLGGAVTDLQNAGISNVGFWTAQPGNTLAFAQGRVATAVGPYPCIGCQYQWLSTVDLDVFSLPWVMTVSGTSLAQLQPHWNWCHKCQGQFYGPNMAKSVCPAGGTHDNTGSGNYTLSNVPGAP